MYVKAKKHTTFILGEAITTATYFLNWFPTKMIRKVHEEVWSTNIPMML